MSGEHDPDAACPGTPVIDREGHLGFVICDYGDGTVSVITTQDGTNVLPYVYPIGELEVASKRQHFAIDPPMMVRLCRALASMVSL